MVVVEKADQNVKKPCLYKGRNLYSGLMVVVEKHMTRVHHRVVTCGLVNGNEPY
jgi:uncharacterized Fe-S center protein